MTELSKRGAYLARAFGALFLCVAAASLLADTASGQTSLVSLRRMALESGRGTLGVKLSASTKTLYVLNRQDRCVWKFNETGSPVGRISSAGQGPGDLLDPVDFAVDPGGRIVVADGMKAVKVFGADGNILNTIEFSRPRAVGVLKDGSILVSGFPKDSLIAVFNTVGQKLRTIGVPIQADEDPFSNSVLNLGFIVVDKSDNIYYVFRHLLSPTVRKYAPDGTLLAEWHPEGDFLKRAVELARTNFAIRKEKKQGGWTTVLNAAAFDPRSGALWVSSGPELMRIGADGKTEATFAPKDVTGAPISANGILFLGDFLVVTSYARGVLEFPMAP